MIGTAIGILEEEEIGTPKKFSPRTQGASRKNVTAVER
jgi:hypothetical protein